jgi:hypothetical protein
MSTASIPCGAGNLACSRLSGGLFATLKSRLKAGCSQDWLPHKALP